MKEDGQDQYVALSDFSGRVDRVNLELLGLPQRVSDGISVNPDYLLRMMNLGGISSLRVRSRHEEDGYQFSIQGVNPQGAGTAAAAVVKSVPIWQLGPGEGENILLERRWVDQEAFWDLRAADLSLRQSGKNVLEAASWVATLREALTDITVKAGVNNLLTNWPIASWLQIANTYLFTAGMMTLNITQRVPFLNNPEGRLATYIAIALVVGKAFNEGFLWMFRFTSPEFRRSMFVGPALDRAVTLCGLGQKAKHTNSLLRIRESGE